MSYLLILINLLAKNVAHFAFAAITLVQAF